MALDFNPLISSIASSLAPVKVSWNFSVPASSTQLKSSSTVR